MIPDIGRKDWEMKLQFTRKEDEAGTHVEE